MFLESLNDCAHACLEDTRLASPARHGLRADRAPWHNQDNPRTRHSTSSACLVVSKQPQRNVLPTPHWQAAAHRPASVESSCTYGATTLLDTSNVATLLLWLAKLAQVMLALAGTGASLMATGNTSQVDSRMGSSGDEPSAAARAVAFRIAAGTLARACARRARFGQHPGSALQGGHLPRFPCSGLMRYTVDCNIEW